MRLSAIRRGLYSPHAQPAPLLQRSRGQPGGGDERASLDRLPESLEGSPTAEKLQAITEIDLNELLAIDPPCGYGRD
jgi:hypothetical protein